MPQGKLKTKVQMPEGTKKQKKTQKKSVLRKGNCRVCLLTFHIVWERDMAKAAVGRVQRGARGPKLFWVHHSVIQRYNYLPQRLDIQEEIF